jgi:DNA polymerase-3 subunit alpha
MPAFVHPYTHSEHFSAKNPVSTEKAEPPRFDLPKGFTAPEYIRCLVLRGLEKRYPENINTVITQAEHELEIITRLGFTDYFLIINDIITWAREHDIPVGPGRGATPSSLTAYALGITGIDPLKYGLVFERFINPARPAMPGISLDFSVEGRDRVVAYVIEKYGINRVGRIAVYGRGKNGEPVPAGLHSAGLVISGNDLEKGAPLYHDPKTGVPVIPYRIFELEAHGLVKFDFMTLKTLDDIKHNETLIRKQGTQFAGFSVNDIPLDDKAVFKLFSDSNTGGFFQFEREEAREFLRQIEPDCFEHLIAANALCRPCCPGLGALIQEFIERRYRRKPEVYLLPCLEDILKETYGLIVYEEQFMGIIQRIAGYTPGQADILWRFLLKAGKSSQKTNIWLSEMNGERERFVAGAAAQGFKEQDADRIFENLASVAGIVFLKSHAAAFSLLTYQTAYLKANFSRHGVYSF